MINYNYITTENKEDHHPNQPQVPDYQQNINNCRLWIWKENVLLHLIKQKDEFIDQNFLYVKDPNQVKNNYLIKKVSRVVSDN